MSARSTTTRGGASTAAAIAAARTRVGTFVAAAVNSNDPLLADAAYRCTGAADQVEINAAIAALPP